MTIHFLNNCGNVDVELRMSFSKVAWQTRSNALHKSGVTSSLIGLTLDQPIFNVVVNGVKGRGGASLFAETMLVIWFF